AVEPDALAAAVAGLVCFEVAAEDAAERASGPGTFRAALMDALAALDGPAVVRRARMTVEGSATGVSTSSPIPARRGGGPIAKSPRRRSAGAPPPCSSG